MSIVLDAMGGDNAPIEIIRGGLEAAPHIKGDLILVGDQTIIKSHLPTHVPANVKIVHASQIVEMDEKPLDAYRKKKDSSMMVGIKLSLTWCKNSGLMTPS